RPRAVRLDDVDAAQAADAAVALLHLAPHVPRAAADLPLVHARFAAEGPPRRLHRPAAPAADGPAVLVSIGNAPLLGADRAGARGAHARVYRRAIRKSLRSASATSAPAPCR